MWPLFAPSEPEDFARTLCVELGLAGEFLPLISTSIREQICSARLEFKEIPYGVGIRDEDGWEPTVRYLNDDEITSMIKEEERIGRRNKRTQRSLPTAPEEREQVIELATYCPVYIDTPLQHIPHISQLERVERKTKTVEWRCEWCNLSPQYTPTIRHGLSGPRKLCQECSIYNERRGKLDESKYRS